MAGAMVSSLIQSAENLADSNPKLLGSSSKVVQKKGKMGAMAGAMVPSLIGVTQKLVASNPRPSGSSSKAAQKEGKRGAMAGAIVSSLTWLAGKLAAWKPRSLGSSSELCDVEEDTIVEDLKKLRRTLLRIKAVLDDAEEREIKDKSVKLWLSELWDLAYEAEDVLDEYEYELLRAKVEGGGTQWPLTKKRDEGPNLAEASHSRSQEGGGTQAVTGKGIEEGGGSQTQDTRKRKREEVCDVILISPIEHSFRAKLSYSIRKFMQKFDEIANDRVALRLKKSDGERHLQNIVKPPTGPYIIDESKFYGRDDDKKRVIELLLSNECGGNNLSVIPIVGMGGIGKTALVQLAYSDSRVCGHFDKMGWVCVSEDFNVVRLTQAIIQSFTNEPTGLTELSVLQATLKKILCVGRFLLVLDDVWNEKPENWELLKAPLTFGRGGSKVLITARSESVAKVMQTVPFYALKCLSEDDCWMVFQSRAFDGQDPNACPVLLVEIGKKIAKKCSGLPLAAKMLGSLLRCETQVERWEDVLESDLWDLEDDLHKPEILPALSLSYVRLPTHLKRCFLYCSLFPKDHQLHKNQMVRLWMAQGFIQPKARKQEEDIGSGYFDELLQRAFFQYTGKTGGVVMHDLIHDLAQSISRKEYSIVEQDTSGNISIQAQHLLFIWNEVGQTLHLQYSHESRALRTFLVMPVMTARYATDVIRLNIDDLFQKFRCLRALDLNGTRIRKLPDSVGNLKHLRCLCLNGTWIKMLPDSVCNLYNLQILEARESCIKELPKDMRKLTNLRHLDVYSNKYYGNVLMHPGIGELTSLQTLAEINVGYSGYCGIQELRDLVNLRELGIYELRNVRNAEDARDADTRNKKSLAKLKLNWSRDFDLKDEDTELAELVLEHLVPHHSNLTELVIENYGGIRFPGWMADPSFSRLVHVILEDSKYCKILPALGQLPSLRNLSIQRMDGVKHVSHKFCSHNDTTVTKGFPSLEKLEFRHMKGWEQWNGVEDGDFPCLSSLIIWNCPELRGLPHLPHSLTELIIHKCRMIELQDNSRRKMWCSGLTKLESLKISGSQVLRSMPLQNLETLKNLEISECPNLTSIDCWSNSSSNSSLVSQGLHNLKTLRCLEIWNCPNLSFTLETQLPLTLQTFHTVAGCPKLKEWCQGCGSTEMARIPQVNLGL